MNKRKFIIPALLFASCIVSCKAIPEDIASFLGNITYYNAVNKVKTITYTSKMNVYDNNQFKGDVIGQKISKFTYKYEGVTDSNIDILYCTYDVTYSGTLVSEGLTHQNMIIEYSKEKDTYLVDVIETKNNKEEKKNTENKGNGYYSNLVSTIFGNPETYMNGLYYGQFLKTQSNRFSDLMTVSEDKEFITYDPPMTGESEDRKNQYLDIILNVDKIGMLTSHIGKYYNDETQQYSYETKKINYEYKGA
ncbi:MAG: hypothetical protein KIB47_04700 [Clostridium sp.]|nr:hypothetical protein [Clostridium sp.]